MVKVKDIMRTVVVSVTSATPVIEVAHQMRESGQSYIPVCEGGKLQGIITERDIVTGIVADGKSPITEPAISVMNRQQPFIFPGDNIARAADTMVKGNVHILPVVEENGRLMGVLTIEELSMESIALATLVFQKQKRLARPAARRKHRQEGI